jgi:hypothetical protein
MALHRKPRTREEKQNLNAHAMANKMRRYFLPKSVFPAPGSTRGMTGNRNTSLSAQNSPNSTPTDSAVIRLVNGTAVWKFATGFVTPPTVTANGITVNTHGVSELTSQGYGNAEGAIINSSDTADNRLIFVHAIGVVE